MRQCSACLNFLPNKQFPCHIDGGGNVDGYGKTCLMCVNDLRRKPKPQASEYAPSPLDYDPTFAPYRRYVWAQRFGKTKHQKRYKQRKLREQARKLRSGEIETLTPPGVAGPVVMPPGDANV